MNTNLLNMLKEMTLDKIVTAMNQMGVIGLVLGGLVTREILERSNVDPEIVQLLNREAINQILEKVASGDIILQDQVVTGTEYSPEVEEEFRKIAKTFLEPKNQNG